MTQRTGLSIVLTLALAAGHLACGSGSVSGSVDGGRGTLNVFLTDAPIDLAEAQNVNVTLTAVIIYPEDSTTLDSVEDPEEGASGAPIVLMSFPATFDLLTLTGGATALLATDEVPAGRYERIRLQISDALIVLKDGTSAPLKIDSQKVDVPIRFRVNRDAENAVTLDFDAAASVQVNQNGNGEYLLRPVVTGTTSSTP